MFQQPNGRNGRNKGSKVKIALQVALLLAVVVWLVHQMNKDERHVIDQSNLSNEDVDFGRKGKAGSENVVIVDSQKSELEGISESNVAGEQAESFSQHTEEKNEEDAASKEQEVSEEVILNDNEKEAKEEQLDNKDDNVESNSGSTDEVPTNNGSDDTKNILQLPSERNGEQSYEQVQGKNEDEHNELTTVDGSNNVGETTDSDKQSSSSTEELDGGEESAISKAITNSQEGTGSDNERSVENNGEDAPGNIFQENNAERTDSEASEKDKLDSEGDINGNSETTEHHTAETINHESRTEEEVVHSGSTEEGTSVMPTENEIPKREAVEEESTIEKSEEDLKKTVTDANPNSGEISITSGAPEKDAVESSNNIPGAEVTISNDIEVEKTDAKSDVEADATQGETPSETDNTENHSNEEQSDETKPAEDAANSSSENQENTNSETSIDETSNVELIESQGGDASEGENNGSIGSDDLETESNPSTETSSE